MMLPYVPTADPPGTLLDVGSPTMPRGHVKGHVKTHVKSPRQAPTIIAARNAHMTIISMGLQSRSRRSRAPAGNARRTSPGGVGRSVLFVDVLGFTPMETLVAATRMGGEIMGMANELGQIRPGFLADLLLVDGDPLADIKLLQRQDADRKSTRLNSSHIQKSRMPSSA